MHDVVKGRIEKEFIFKFLIANAVHFEIEIKNLSTTAILLDHSHKELKFELTNTLAHNQLIGKPILIFFYFQNNFHSFHSKILDARGDIIIVENPEEISKNLQRKYERIKIKEKIDLNFRIKGDLALLDFPQTAINYYPKTPPIEANFNDVSIENIVKKFNDKISGFVTKSKLRMLRNYNPSSFDEQMVIKYGKVMYVADTHSELPQKQLFSKFNILLKTDWINFEILTNKTQPYLVNKVLSDYLTNLSNSGIFSQAIFPVLYRNYIVAFIYLLNDHKRSVPISENILNYTHQFTRLLSYMLKENGYFKEEEINSVTHTTQIYDLSPGGLAFMHPDDFYEDKLLLNHNVELAFTLNDKKIKILAKLVRKSKKVNRYFYGLMFIDIKKLDFEFLKSYLYTG